MGRERPPYSLWPPPAPVGQQRRDLGLGDDQKLRDIGSEKIRDARLVLDRNGVRLDDESGNMLKIESTTGAITIKCNGTLKLQSQQISIEAGASLSIRASGDLSIQGTIVRIN